MRFHFGWLTLLKDVAAVTMQTGLLTAVWAMVYLTDVSAVKLFGIQLCFLTVHGTVGHSLRGIKNSDGMTVICYFMCHSQSYTQTRYSYQL